MAIAKTIDTPLGTFSTKALLAAIIAASCIGAILANRISLYLQRRKFKLRHGCKPAPGIPVKDPFFGSDYIRGRLQAAKDHRLLDFSKATFDKHGNTLANSLGGQAIILTIEPQNVKTILSLKFKDFGLGNREETLGPLLGRGIFTSDGEPWAHSRAMIRPNFARDQVADLAAFERLLQVLFKLLPTDGETVDLQELFFKFTIDSSTEFLFGQSTGTLQAALSKTEGVESDFARAFNKAQHFCATRGRMGLLRKFQRDPAGGDAIRICHEFVDQFVDEALRYREKIDLEGDAAVKGEKYVFLHELAKSTKDKLRLRDELLNVLLAGRDTTASLLSNMWFEIAKQPDVFRKLKEEVEETLQGRLPSYEQLRNMKYLKWCMQESLRIHPVVPGNSRVAYRDTVLPTGGGPQGTSPVFVSKGTIVAYWPYAMHRRRDIYGADADEFRPGRWESLRPGWEYLPFNGGPRICLGQQYALTEAGYVTVRLLQQFGKIESRDDGPWMENFTLTVCSWNGTKVALTPA